MASDNKPIKFIRPISRVVFSRMDVVLASFALNVLTLALPLVVLQVYDRIIPSQSTDTFTFMVLGLVTVVLLDGGLRYLRTYVTTWAGTRFEHAASVRACDAFLGAEVQDFETTPPGVQMERYSAIEALREHQSGQGLVSYTELPFAFLFVGLIFVIGGPLVYAPIAVCVIAALFAIWLGISLDRIIRERNELDDNRYNFIFQVLNGIHSVKGLGMEALMCRHYQHLHAPVSHVMERLVFYSSLGQSVGAILSNFAMISVALMGSIFVINGDLTGGSLMACTLLGGRAIQPLIRMIGVWVQYRSLKLSNERLNALGGIRQENNSPENIEKTPEITGDIRFEQATIYQSNTGFPIFKDLDLHIKSGEIIAILGQVGGGKSALLETIAGFIPVTEGSMKFDGVDSNDISYRKLRRQMGYVRQNAPLFRGTLRENLTKFRNRDHLPAALEVADRLGLSEIIAAMPKGLETAVGESASEGLSGSVQQMVSLTLTFADKPKILLLDEANTALDGDADRRLREYLETLKGEATVLMITERPSLINIADRVLDASHGVVKQIEWEGFGPAKPKAPEPDAKKDNTEGAKAS
ncbi:ABC transporter transmembrane domain-containing protein [Terasakiella sp. A23]|uniref:peptidase domain-containing ABC transporter n=1 Tax=Terasakiella sp. FCG-A23 TaxID=3080561 RepID=UPI002953C1D8|nr:ABC transporter transmembrane domain-containing protein [Terasakiella sp. A23]MDV7340567.1 ABC transporter transmembrane domain-containing protein [Terasakiella sp. A23]